MATPSPYNNCRLGFVEKMPPDGTGLVYTRTMDPGRNKLLSKEYSLVNTVRGHIVLTSSNSLLDMPLPYQFRQINQDFIFWNGGICHDNHTSHNRLQVSLSNLTSMDTFTISSLMKAPERHTADRPDPLSCWTHQYVNQSDTLLLNYFKTFLMDKCDVVVMAPLSPNG